MNIRRPKNSGFTLIEIMIVVAIIGLLAAIAVPNFVRARTASQMNACINNLRQIDGALQQYGLEKNLEPTAAAPAFSQLSAYLEGSVTCPAAGVNATFASSYSLPPAISGKPTCRIKGTDARYPHALPLDTTN